ncbi:MAG: hypothetical protein HYX32_01545 [Actinobacteria bacterium]|nr:hypothetical protein [Actinomycetota bacterium]
MARLCCVVLVSLAVSAPIAEAQAPPATVPVNECVPGVTVPTNVPANGPSPVGTCEPSTKQRAIDTAVWLFLLALLVLVAAIGVVSLGRSVRGGSAASVAADD